MKWFRPIALLLCASTAIVIPAMASETSTKASDNDPLVAMYAWWNEAIKTPGALTEEAFGRYFTADGAIVINGEVFAKGLPALVEHFRKIQAAGGHTETILPFRHEFRSGNDIYTYQVIDIVRNGATTCLLAAGHAEVRDGKLSLVNLVRAKVDPTGVPECTRQ